MSDSNIQFGIGWDKYPPNTSMEFKLFDQKRSEALSSVISDINKQQNGLGSLEQQLNDIGISISDINSTTSNLGEQIGGLNEQIGNNDGGYLTTTDYAKLNTGGVVLLAAKINPLEAFTGNAAPTSYDQADEQKFRDGVTTSLNAIITKVNEIISGQQSAKQMEGL